MSTRCTTHFVWSDAGSKPTAIIYRHSDGYPSGAGTDLLQFIDECAKLPDSRLNDPSYLAAKYVVFLADIFNKRYNYQTKEYERPESKLDFLSVGVMDQDPGDIEYRYIVKCSSGWTGKDRPEVKCYAIHKHEFVPIPAPANQETVVN